MKTDTNMLGSHGNAGSDAGGLGRCIPITFPGNLHAGGDHTWGHGGLDHGEEDPEMVRGATRPPVPQAGRLEEAPSSLDSGRRRPGAGQKRSSDHREGGLPCRPLLVQQASVETPGCFLLKTVLLLHMGFS